MMERNPITYPVMCQTTNSTNSHLQTTVNTNWKTEQDPHQRPFTGQAPDRQHFATGLGPSREDATTWHGRHLPQYVPAGQHMGNSIMAISSLQPQGKQILGNNIHPVENLPMTASERNLNYGRKFHNIPEQPPSQSAINMVHQISQPPLLEPPFSRPPPHIPHPRMPTGNSDAHECLPTAFPQQPPMRPSLTQPEIMSFRSNSVSPNFPSTMHMKPVRNNVPGQFVQPQPPVPHQIGFRHPHSVPPPPPRPPLPQYGGSDIHSFHPQPQMYHVGQSGSCIPARPSFHGHHMPLLGTNERPSLSSVSQNVSPHLPRSPVIYLDSGQVMIGAQSDGAVIPSIKSEQERLDEEWISSWVQKLGVKKISKQPRCSRNVNVLEYEQMMKRLVSAQDELQTCMAQLEAMLQDGANVDTDATKEFIEHAKEIKKQIAAQSEMVNDEELVLSIQKQVQERQKKRERLKRRKQERYAEQQEIKKRRAELHVQIDQWRNSIYEKDRTAKEAQELKGQADTVLSEVRKKMLDAKRMQALVKKLGKLRLIRKEAVLNKGHNVLDFFEDEFEAKTSNILRIMAERTEIYEAEENALKVLVETEQEEEKEKAREIAQKREADRRQREERRVIEQLFGKEVCLYEHDPILPFTQYYKQAEGNMAALYHIRKEWDMFLVPPHVPGASRVPRGWVIPAEPSSDLWREQLVTSATKQQTIETKQTTNL